MSGCLLLFALLAQTGGIEALPEREEITEDLLERLEDLQENPLDPNTAPPEDLYSVPLLTADQVARILTLRKQKPFSSWADFRRRVGLDPVAAQLLREAFTFRHIRPERGRIYTRMEHGPAGQKVDLRGDLLWGKRLRFGVRWRRTEGNPILRAALLWTPGRWGIQGVALGHIAPLLGLGLLQGPPAFFSGFRPPSGPTPGFLRPTPAPGLWVSWRGSSLAFQTVLAQSHQAFQIGFPLPGGAAGLVGTREGASLWGQKVWGRRAVALEIGRYGSAWSGLFSAKQSFPEGRVELGGLLRGDLLPQTSRYASLKPGAYLHFAVRGKGPGGLAFRVLRLFRVREQPTGAFRSWRGDYLLILNREDFQVSLALKEGQDGLAARPPVWVIRLQREDLRCELHRSGESFALSGQLRWQSWAFFAHIFTAPKRGIALFEPGLPDFPRRVWLSGEGSRVGVRVKGYWGNLLWALKGAWERRENLWTQEVGLLFSLSGPLYPFL